MQGFDEHFLADPGFAMNQQRNVFFQQALGLAHGFFYTAVAKMQSIEADRRRCLYGRFHEHSGLDRHLFRTFEQALETIASGGLEREGQAFGLIQQLQQRDLEQALDTDPRQAHAEQVVGAAVGGQHLAALIENQQAGPLAVEVVQAGVESQLKMLAVEQVEDQPVFHGLAHHLDHAQGVGWRQVAVAGHVQHRDHLALGIENRRGGTGHEAVGLEEVLIVLDVHRLLAGQGGTDRIGPAAALHPTGARAEATGQARLDKPLGAPGRQHLALIVGEHDQAIGVAQDVFVIRQHFLMGGLHQ
ncbi:hypothetical protein D3C76_785650 [compost metagenome]